MSLVSEGIEVRSPLVAGVGEPSLATVGDYIALMKPRVMSLVVFTALVGLAVAPGSLHPVAAFTALLCIAVGAGAAGALNMWYDADVDARQVLLIRCAEERRYPGKARPQLRIGELGITDWYLDHDGLYVVQRLCDDRFGSAQVAA